MIALIHLQHSIEQLHNTRVRVLLGVLDVVDVVSRSEVYNDKTLPR